MQVLDKAQGAFKSKDFFFFLAPNDPKTVPAQRLYFLLPLKSERCKCKNQEPTPSIPQPRAVMLSLAPPCGFQDRKMKERGVVVNHSKERRETKWGTSHGHSLNFSQLKIRGSVCFRPLSTGWLDFFILGIVV